MFIIFSTQFCALATVVPFSKTFNKLHTIVIDFRHKRRLWKTNFLVNFFMAQQMKYLQPKQIGENRSKRALMHTHTMFCFMPIVGCPVSSRIWILSTDSERNFWNGEITHMHSITKKSTLQQNTVQIKTNTMI